MATSQNPKSNTNFVLNIPAVITGRTITITPATTTTHNEITGVDDITQVSQISGGSGEFYNGNYDAGKTVDILTVNFKASDDAGYYFIEGSEESPHITIDNEESVGGTFITTEKIISRNTNGIVEMEIDLSYKVPLIPSPQFGYPTINFIGEIYAEEADTRLITNYTTATKISNIAQNISAVIHGDEGAEFTVTCTGSDGTTNITGVPTATVTITDFLELNAGDIVRLIATDGGSFSFINGDQSSVNGTWNSATSNDVTATNLMNVINTSSGPSGTRFSATVDGAVVTITQNTPGAAGNTTVTLTDSGTAGMTSTSFVGVDAIKTIAIGDDSASDEGFSDNVGVSVVSLSIPAKVVDVTWTVTIVPESGTTLASGLVALSVLQEGLKTLTFTDDNTGLTNMAFPDNITTYSANHGLSKRWVERQSRNINTLISENTDDITIVITAASGVVTLKTLSPKPVAATSFTNIKTNGVIITNIRTVQTSATVVTLTFNVKLPVIIANISSAIKLSEFLTN